MKSNELMQESLKDNAAAAEAEACTPAVDPCTIQYYCPQPIVGARLAHAYVPFQYLCCMYPPEKALTQGTVFPELDRAYGMDPEYVIDA